ncbi:MAG: TatD family hydrolase [Spirochaetales bacterium]|nr:TatD family hydrolase [Spirochaetales bacterium]
MDTTRVLLSDSHLHLHLGSGIFPSMARRWKGCSCAVSTQDWDAALTAAKAAPGATVFFGIHPWYASGDLDRTLSRLEDLLSAEPSAGIGEIGLDAFRADTDLDTQRIWFREQMRLARTYNRPVSIHCVRAFGPLMDELTAMPGSLPPFCIHSFNGSREIMDRIIRRGGSVSFSAFSLKGASGKSADCLHHAQDGHFLLDTDFPSREGQNLKEYPGMLTALYEEAARIRDVHVERIAALTAEAFAPFSGETTV